MIDSLTEWIFDNSFVRDLPADPETKNFRREVDGIAYSRVSPAPVQAPALAAYSRETAALLDLSEAAVADPRFVEVMSGNAVPAGADPFAMAYAGHQFGSFAGQLGDGRAIALGEVVGSEAGRQMIQLKGAGPTPYSRGADGRAVLRSSVREFLCSEAMHHLGVPTTRALSLVTTGDQIMRDMFYDGNAGNEPGAVVCRVAPTFIRFGNFEFAYWRDDNELLRGLADHTIRGFFPHLLASQDAPITEDVYIRWFEEIVARTVEMIAAWMGVGFVHGVMNTDNMSILGLTIDYGDPGWTPNTTDASRKRYRYEAQPQIAHWNLMRLANAIVPLIDDVEPLQGALDRYRDQYSARWSGVLNAKLGLIDERDGDASLVADLFGLLQRRETDMTIFFRALSDLGVDQVLTAESDAETALLVSNAWYSPDASTADLVATASWLRAWATRVSSESRPDAARQAAMAAVNPKFVLRNFLAQVAIDKAEQGDMSEIDLLLDVMRRPYDDQPERHEYAARRPEWARERAGCSMLSCSS